jgi:diguanylate cyclase (GGDEF)-like protein
MVKETAPAITILFVNNLRLRISEYQFLADKQLSVTTSIGISNIKKTETFKQGFHTADQALLKAKKSGRNYCISAN